jgi:hypothetical protein
MCARIRGPENGPRVHGEGDGESQKAKDQPVQAGKQKSQRPEGQGPRPAAARGLHVLWPRVPGTSSWAGSAKWPRNPVLTLYFVLYCTKYFAPPSLRFRREIFLIPFFSSLISPFWARLSHGTE